MWLGPDSQGQQPLISEAVRGEGAFLVDFEGARFMQGQHELADLAPARRGRQGDHPADDRDRPARTCGSTPATSARTSGSGASPRSSAVCREHGVDPVTELIPVAPAQHYASGGVATDL